MNVQDIFSMFYVQIIKNSTENTRQLRTTMHPNVKKDFTVSVTPDRLKI